MPAIDDALEIAIGGALELGTGDIVGGMEVDDLMGAGSGGSLAVGYRITPNLTLGGYATVTGYSSGDHYDGTPHDVASTTAGLEADWHFRPRTTFDPWVGAGAGVRKLWIDDEEGETNQMIGLELELGRVQAGVDYRLSPSFSIGPVIGASASMYVEQRTQQMTEELDDKRVNWTFSAGILGRFAAFGTRR